MKKILNYSLVFILAVFLNSCYYDAYPEYEELDTDLEPNENVSYANDIVPLWGACISCHQGNTPPDLEDNSYANLLNGYVVAGDAENSVLYMSLLGTGGISLMPPGASWPQSKINLVKDWIDQGAKNN